MQRALPATLFLLLLPWAGVAAEPPKRFEIVMVWTDGPEGFLSRYDKGIPPDLESVKVAPRGKRLAALVLFRNCKPDDKGECNIEVDSIAYTPDGKVYHYRTDSQFWHARPGKPAGELELGRRAMGIMIDPGDPAGTWRVTATARDRIANTEAGAEWRFEVEPE